VNPSATPVVVLDVGNVLVEWDLGRLYPDLDEDGRRRFLSEVLTPDVNLRVDRGETLVGVCAELVAHWPEHADLVARYRDRWLDSLGPVIGGSVQVLDELVAAGVRCLALSNFGRETFAAARPRLGFLDRFEAVVTSAEVGLVKPDPAIYLLLCERHGFAPAEAVFVDDNAANVAAAAALGFDAVLFTGAASLRWELRERGLPLAP
jgi:2-haloacid dehalogenase